MKKITLIIALSIISFCSNAQYKVNFETSFNGWVPNKGWVLLSNDTIPTKPSLLYENYNGVGTNPLTEIINYMLGINKNGALDKVIFTPPIALGNNPYLQFFNVHNTFTTGSNQLTVYIVHKINDTTLSALTDTLVIPNSGQFTNVSLNSVANDTIRIAFRFKGYNNGTLVANYIDDLLIYDKKSLAYIPDSCFRNILKTIVPTAFIGDSLDYSKNVVVNLRRINAPNGCIKSLDGLQYFPFLKQLDFSNNSIQYFPYVSFRHLDSLVASNNFIRFLPDFPHAYYFDLDNNLLTHFWDYFHNYLSWMKVRNNLIFDCFQCSNRFAYADFYGNPQILHNGCLYYNLTFYKNTQFEIPTCTTNKFGFVKGEIYYDENKNGTKDSGEYRFPNQHLNYLSGPDIFGTPYGEYNIEVDTGIVKLHVSNLPSGFVCSNQLNDTISVDETIEHDFAITTSSKINDLKLTLKSAPTIVENQKLSLCLTVQNIGALSNSGIVKMHIPTGYKVFKNDAGTIKNDTLIWNVVINPFFTTSNFITLELDTFYVNQVHIFKSELIAINDQNLTNNRSNDTIRSVGGFPYDPNNKLVSKPVVHPGYNDYLEYNINFQNIGTGNAKRVIVRDYLPTELDPTTFELIGTSHPCVVTFGNDSLIQFTFKPIALTPLSIDPIHSEGHIWFRIKPKKPISIGDTIKNDAGIYFDNEAVVNTEICKVWAENTDANFSATSNACINAPIQFSDLSSGSPTNWQWTFPSGSPSSSNQKNPFVIYTTFGPKSAQLITTWPHGTDTISYNNLFSVGTAPKVTISALGNTTFCQGSSVTLMASSPNAIQWSNSDTTQSIIVSQSDNYTVTLLGTNDCKSIDSIKVNVVQNPLPAIISINGDTSICVGNSLTLSGNNGGIWNTGDTNSTITIIKPGVYYITNNNMCASVKSDSVNVSITALPIASSITSTNTLICAGDSTNLQGNFGGMWNNGSLANSITIQKPGDYYVVKSNKCGIDTSNIISVKINQVPIAPTISALNNTTICSGDSVKLIGNNGGFWNNNSSANSLSIYATGNYYVVTKNTCGSDTSNIIKVTVNNPPIAPAINAIGSTTICSGDSVILTGNVGGTWNTNTSTNQIKTFTAGSFYVVKSSACGIDTSNIITITVNQFPVAPVISAAGNTNICEGDSVILIGNSGGSWNNNSNSNQFKTFRTGNYYVVKSNNCGSDTSNIITVSVTAMPNDSVIQSSNVLTAIDSNLTYQWINCSSMTIIGGETNQTFVASSNGDYAVILSQNNCIDTSACINISTTAIGRTMDIADTNFSIYPNPATNKLTIKTSSPTIIYFQNSLGQILKSINIQTQNTIDVSEFANGIYFVKSSNGNTLKFVKD